MGEKPTQADEKDVSGLESETERRQHQPLIVREGQAAPVADAAGGPADIAVGDPLEMLSPPQPQQGATINNSKSNNLRQAGPQGTSGEGEDAGQDDPARLAIKEKGGPQGPGETPKSASK